MSAPPSVGDRVAGDLVASAALVLLACGIWVESTRWPPAADFAGNPLLVPRALAVLMCVVAAVLSWRALRRMRGAGGGRSSDRGGDIGRVGGSVVATVALGALLEPLGMPAAAFAYLLVMQRLTATPWLRAVAVATLVPLLIWTVFAVGLNVPLPVGTLWD